MAINIVTSRVTKLAFATLPAATAMLTAVATLTAQTLPAVACARTSPVDAALTPAGANIYEGGGVIMTVQYGFGAKPVSLALRQPGGAATAKVVALGPNLSVLQLGTAGSDLELVDQTSTVTARYKVIAAPPALATPSVGSIVATRPVPSSPSATPASTTTISLSVAPPADAFALVIYDAHGATPQPHAWIPVQTGTLVYTLVTGGKSCNAGGTALPTQPGDVMRFAWLDRGGRVSAMTKSTRVGTSK